MTKSGISVQRVSIPYHVPSTGNSHGETHHYPHMFAEDVARDLFPIGGDVDREPVFRLSSDDEHISRVIESAFARYGDYGGRGRPLSSILSGFGNQTAHGVVSSGAETFEVAPTVDANGQTIGFLVLRLHRACGFLGFTWQTIPKNALADAHWESPKPVDRRLVRIPRDRVVRMRLPREYRRVPSGLRALRHIGSAVPDFAIQNLNSDGTIRVPYDLEELKEVEHRAVATATRSTGWLGRGAFGDAVTGYYTMCRFLRFEEFKVKLRGTVVDTINRILAVAGATVGSTAVVSLHHLPTLEEIAVSRDDLAAGRLEFREMMDQYSIYRRRGAPSDK